MVRYPKVEPLPGMQILTNILAVDRGIKYQVPTVTLISASNKSALALFHQKAVSSKSNILLKPSNLDQPQ